MRQPSYTNQFEKDVNRMQRRGKDIQRMKAVILDLIAEKQLDRQFRDHVLVGDYKGRRECHIEPNWLLVYKVADNEIIFERTGTHPDLFK